MYEGASRVEPQHRELEEETERMHGHEPTTIQVITSESHLDDHMYDKSSGGNQNMEFSQDGVY